MEKPRQPSQEKQRRAIIRTIEARGRPPKLSPAIQTKILAAIRAGNYLETAAAYAGISKSSLYLWLKAGARSESGPYHEFSDAVKKALAEAEVNDVEIDRESGDPKLAGGCVAIGAEVSQSVGSRREAARRTLA